jgi:hypothetical protein
MTQFHINLPSEKQGSLSLLTYKILLHSQGVKFTTIGKERGLEGDLFDTARAY